MSTENKVQRKEMKKLILSIILILNTVSIIYIVCYLLHEPAVNYDKHDILIELDNGHIPEPEKPDYQKLFSINEDKFLRCDEKFMEAVRANDIEAVKHYNKMLQIYCKRSERLYKLMYPNKE